ncbi:hypothetical protein PSN45_001909 [Yamadazyma tenuis]|uniref:Uncharacterized protein n=1 Tax=Candida tenuis (strain ATCC 10573 / BCRC 21748 / CBS 615 / JCM 9827 / NBRC 10315 / NRRL Y-1498 / VKM Y-70) TaxID=590646 RepID=G3BDM3_CANTC|nr:uncharacterized protein CANTEDRAFT_136817 [Yamadazyma tenuis ATCC 10573]EGV60338.1 hypothetical protein CANTEDRAFT_136817 [Yamadazyma tenuis ATCC 10573]WEJ94425.1 hypothetical protein PSN45_001909 [Yamadazyma tenuis]
MNNELKQLSEDLHQVKGCVGQLQGAFQHIMKVFPPPKQYEQLVQLVNSLDPSGLSADDNTILQKLKNLLNCAPVKVGAKIKSLVDEDKLPFLQALGAIPSMKFLQAPTLDYLLDYGHESYRISEDLAILKELESSEDDLQDSAEYGKGEIQLPMLLPLQDELLFQKAFHDPSFVDPIIEIQDVSKYTSFFNTKLIHQGTYYLKLILWELVDFKYPHIYYADAEVLVSKLMDHNVLFKLSLVYRLVDNFKFKLSDRISFENKISMISDLFLSYMGALSIEKSLPELKIWVYKVFRVILPKLKQQDFKSNTLGPAIRSMFTFTFSEMNYHFETLESDPYVVKLYIKGVSTIGTNSKSEELAQLNAIKEFMNNKDYKHKLLHEQYLISYKANELKQDVDRFEKLLQDNNIAVSYETNSAGPVYHCVIKWNAVVLGVGIDKSETMAIKKSQQSSYNNLSVLLKQDNL